MTATKYTVIVLEHCRGRKVELDKFSGTPERIAGRLLAKYGTYPERWLELPAREFLQLRLGEEEGVRK